MKRIQYVFRIFKVPSPLTEALCRPRVLPTSRSMSTSTNLHDDLELNISEDIRKQILQAGLHYLTDVDKLKESVAKRNSEADVVELVKLHDKYKQLVQSVVDLRHQRNIASKQFVNLKNEKDKSEAVELGAQLKHATTRLENEKFHLENEMLSKLSLLPNYSHPDTPIGGYEASNIVEYHGDKKEFSFPVRDHVDLAEQLGLVDFRAARNASGSSFYYLEGAAALLEIALVQYTMQKAVAKGYRPVITPDVVKTDLVEGCGFHPRGPANQVYHVTSTHVGSSRLCLAGTAEIPLAGKFMRNVIQLDQLPVRLVAFGRCYRAETGGKGHATRGLYRVHQFSKVELFGLTSQETAMESELLLEEMVSLQKEILSSLGLHFRVMEMATCELGSPAYRKFDIEAWMPGRGEYGEVTSASNCTDYQSRRLRITYPNPLRDGVKSNETKSREPGIKYAHTVNGTACAVPRIIIALLENYQQEDGTVILPNVLRSFLPEHCWHLKPLVM